MLSCELCNSIANLRPDRVVGLIGQALQQLCADSLALWRLESQEEICCLTRLGLARLRGLSPEDNGGECSSLSAVSAFMSKLLYLSMTYRCLLGQLNLFREAHQKDFWPLGNPLLVQLLFCRCALHIVGRLEALQQVCKGGMYFGQEDRHDVWVS